jgi:hypothetical protein
MKKSRNPKSELDSCSFVMYWISGFQCKNAAKVMNDMPWTFYGTHTTAQAISFIDNRTAIMYFYSAGCTGTFADTTAYAADLAFLTGFNSLIMVGAFYGDIICTFMNMYDLLRTVTHAHATGNTFLFINLGDTMIINGNCIKFANRNACLTGKTAIAAFRSFYAAATASITGDQCSLVGESFLNSHHPSFLSYGVFVIGKV